eukprot:1151760-Pelagomonas_calceolata.AAC.9
MRRTEQGDITVLVNASWPQSKRHSKAPTPAPAPEPNIMSDRSINDRDSNISNNGCSSADKQESVRKKQVSEPATVTSRAAEFWALLESKGGCFRCPERMELAELILVMVPGSSALKCLKSPQRSSLKEKHADVCAQGLKSMEYDLVPLPYPDAFGRWLDAKKRE